MSARDLNCLKDDKNRLPAILKPRKRSAALSASGLPASRRLPVKKVTVPVTTKVGNDKEQRREAQKKFFEKVEMRDPAKLSTENIMNLASYLLGCSNSSLKSQLRKVSKVSGIAKGPFGMKKRVVTAASSSGDSEARQRKTESKRRMIPSKNVVTLPSLAIRLDTANHPPAFRAMKKVAEKQSYYRQLLQIVVHNDRDVLIEAERRVRERILEDPELNGQVKRKAVPKIKQAVMKVMAHRLYSQLGEWDDRKAWKGKMARNPGKDEVGFQEELIPFAMNSKYTPPEERVLLTSNLSPNVYDNLLVYSDLEHEVKNLARTEIPENMFYTYSDRNTVPESRYQELTSFTKLSETKENIIRCDCCSRDPIVKCWQNPDCPCYKMNVALMERQRPEYHDNFHGKTTFSTFEPVILKTTEFYETIGFACSHACACSGKCTNNVTLIPEKKVNEYEIFRRSSLLGFGVRALNFIPAGMPLMEFVGEIEKSDDIVGEANNYSYAIVDPEMEQTLKGVHELNPNWSEQFVEDMMAIQKTRWCVNPLTVGNIARTCCHSCEPNATMVRVFQKGFSPAHTRLMLVAVEDIFPGAEITIDYGASYWAGKTCRCDKIGCASNEKNEVLKKTSQKALREYYCIRHHKQYYDFKKEVLSAFD